jgi:uncharacterized protein
VPTSTVREVLERIDRDPGLRRVRELGLDDLADDPGHDASHALRVAVWTLRIHSDPREERNGIAAALLHDLINVPKDSPRRARASELSARAARPILEQAGFAPNATEAICQAIRDHSFSAGRTPTTELGRALQDADRLEALGALGIFRTISTGVAMGAHYFHPGDPWARHRELDDRAYTVDHFYRKLLLLPERMNTPVGRAEAERRVAFMRAFLEQLATELDSLQR